VLVRANYIRQRWSIFWARQHDLVSCEYGLLVIAMWSPSYIDQSQHNLHNVE
jgi:hypothetical protein